ncbi:MAG: ABC transporter permease [Azospirillaceae bacterium]|nr:ABC transporter permease [Azospirillaceae bacterium]
MRKFSERSTRSTFSLRKLKDFVLELILLAIILALAAGAPGFASWDNAMNILRNASMTGVIAFGMTFVIISGEIDISVGSEVAFFGCLLAVITQDLGELGWPLGVAILLGVIVCFATAIVIGIITGWIRHTLNVPTFITTLAWMAALRGGAYLLTNSFPVTPYPDWFFFFGSGFIAGIPFQAVVFLIVFAATWFLSKYTVLGRSIYAIGGNAESARLSGIKVRKVRMIVMAMISVFAVMSGIMVSSQIQAGNPTVGAGLEFTVISACVIGGVSLMGGKGRIWGTFVGVLFLEVILNGMTLLNIDEYWQYVARAVLILGAVLIYQVQAIGKRG